MAVLVDKVTHGPSVTLAVPASRGGNAARASRERVRLPRYAPVHRLQQQLYRTARVPSEQSLSSLASRK